MISGYLRLLFQDEEVSKEVQGIKLYGQRFMQEGILQG